MTEEQLKVSQSVTPFYDFQQPTAGALSRLSEHLFGIATKLKQNGTESQKERFKQLSNDYVIIRQSVSQSFIYEFQIQQLEQRLEAKVREIAELKKENEKLIKTLNF